MPVFTANIPADLKIGDRIEIGGKIKKNARKMSVNLCAQEGEEPRDVVLHFDVRFHRDNIISLSRKNGLWIGSGNYDTNYNMFVPGTMFRIIFEIKDTDVITIYCQGKFHSNFLPKIPLTMAKYIVAWADIQRITHCYFHTGVKAPGGDQPPVAPLSPRPTASPAVGLENKRSTRVRKHPVQDCPQLRSSESSDDEQSVKVRPKTEGRADKFFYETLMCQQSRETTKFGGAAAEPRYRSASRERVRPDCSRKFEQEHESDYSEDITSKNDYSVADDTEVMPGKKQMRRGKFPFSQFVNLMGKTNRRN
ncbi:uncharacterized protein LOC133532204 isoform X2 [Cydia pomonella]|uniref:uncharacterized protein LOC133532204 isoform X2 n=1 Tax=Cydia pomonella TaxID=82600 RepID=UPI002ADD8B5F|nr:uncharacterized protein LOC133532204 isoform X2 [Cydia pomonella]